MNFYREVKRECDAVGIDCEVITVPDEFNPTPNDFAELARDIERRTKPNEAMLDNSKINVMNSLPCCCDGEDILNKDFPPFKVTEATKKDVITNPDRYLNCPPRVRMGLFYTDEEYENYITESLNKPLPGDDKVKKHSFFNLGKKKK